MTKIDFKKSKDYEIRKICALCESSSLKDLLDFGKTPLANSYLSKKNIKQKNYPLVCCICKVCGHLQLRHLIKPTILFKNYQTIPIVKNSACDYHYSNSLIVIDAMKSSNLLFLKKSATI